MDWLKLIHGAPKSSAPALTPGDDVRVWFKIREQDKERLAQFEGVVIRLRGPGTSRTFTVRRLTHGEGVERCFPLDSPLIDHIDVLRRGKAKRSRLYFLRKMVKRTRLASVKGPGGGALSGEPSGTVSSQQADAQADNPTAALVAGEHPSPRERDKS